MDTKNETKELSTKERLERLERLVVKVLMSIPLPDPLVSKLVDIETLPMPTRIALRSRYYRGEPEYLAEDQYAIDSILAICSDSINAVQARLDADAAEQEAIGVAKEREAANAQKLAAQESLRAAEAKLDSLSSPSAG